MTRVEITQLEYMYTLKWLPSKRKQTNGYEIHSSGRIGDAFTNYITGELLFKVSCLTMRLQFVVTMF